MPIYYKYYNKNRGAQVILKTGKCIIKLQIYSIELFDVVKKDVEKEFDETGDFCKNHTLHNFSCNVGSHVLFLFPN